MPKDTSSTRSRTTRRSTRPASALRSAIEPLETRRMLCWAHLQDPGYTGDGEAPQYSARGVQGGPEVAPLIDSGGLRWSNRGTSTTDSDNFNATYGAQAENARNVVQAAFDAWRRVIPGFNQTGGNNQLDVTVTAMGRGVGGQGGSGGVSTLLGDKPRTSQINLGGGSDANGNGTVEDAEGFWLDPTPYDNKEFQGNIVNAFTGDAQAGSPALNKADLFSLVTVELQHALGITSTGGNSIAWRTDPNDYLHSTTQADTTDTPGFLWYINSPRAQVLFTSNNGGAGGSDRGIAVHTARPNQSTVADGITYTGQTDTGTTGYPTGRRYMPSHVGAMTLGDMYGYTITPPESFGTFYGVVDPATKVLTVRGGATAGLPSSNDLITVQAISTSALITIDIGNDIAGTNLNGSFTSTYARSNVTSIVVNAGDGNDTIRMESNDGIPCTVNGDDGNDFLDFAFASKNLSNITANTVVNGGNGSDQIFAYDNNQGFAQTYTITSGRFDRPGWGGLFYAADVEFENLTTGALADTVNVQSTFANSPVWVWNAGGADTVNVGNTTNGIRSINSNLTINNDPSLTTLNINNGPDTGARTWNVDGVGNLGYIIGMAPANIYWDNADIQAINLTCGSGVDTGQFVISTETFNVNNAGGDDFITVGVPAALGLQLISGQITIDNSPAHTTLTLDDNGDSIIRNVVIDEAAGYNTVAGLCSGLIRFDSVDVSSATIITGSGNDTVSVLRNDESLNIVNFGGLDGVTIGNATNGVQSITSAVSISSPFSPILVTINNGPDTTARTATLQSAIVNGNTFSEWTGLAPAAIRYRDQIGATVTFGSGNDSVTVIPHDASGNRTINSNLSISGNGGSDTVTVDDTTNSLPIDYTFSNPSGAGVQSISGLGSAPTNRLDTTSVENQIVKAGGGLDRFFVNQFQSGGSLSLFGGGGNDQMSFGNGNLATNITSIASFSFDGQGGSDSFFLDNHLTAAADGWSYFAQAANVLASRNAGGGYSITLVKSNVEQITVTGGLGVDLMTATAVLSGEALTYNGGDGGDTLQFDPSGNFSTIQGRVTFNGQAGSNSINQPFSASGTSTVLHLTENTIGFPYDNFFGPGGSVQFSGVNNILLTLGSNHDFVYAQPNPTATVNIRGGNPTVTPGDTIYLALASTQNPVINGTPASGSVTSSNRQTLTYSGFEDRYSDAIAPAVASQYFAYDAPRQTFDVYFSEAVNLVQGAGSLTVTNTTTGQVVPAANMALSTFDEGPTIAHFTFPGYTNGILPEGRYAATFAAGAFSDNSGNTSPATAPFNFFFVGADANHDAKVNALDFNALATNFGSSDTAFSQGDFNYDGTVNSLDFNALATRFGTKLAAPGDGVGSLTARSNVATASQVFRRGGTPIFATGPSRIDDDLGIAGLLV